MRAYVTMNSLIILFFIFIVFQYINIVDNTNTSN